MPLARAPQCCCGGPGVLRIPVGGVPGGGFGGFTLVANVRLVNPQYDFDGTTPRRTPCWAELGSVTAPPCYPAEGHLLGYDYANDWLLYQPGFVWENVQSEKITPGATMPAAWGEDNQIRYVDLGSCFDGESDDAQLIAGSDAWDILQGSLPSSDPADYTGNPTALFAQISRPTASDVYRIYGHTRWITDSDTDTTYFKVWSVLYDGTDYTEHFTHSADNDGYAMRSMNVQAAEVFTMDTTVANGFRVYNDNTAVAATDDGPDINSFGFFPGAVGKIESQHIALYMQGSLTLSRLMIVEEDADWGQWPYSASAILFETEEDTDADDIPDTTMGYFPVSIAWDEGKRALVVVWIPGYDPDDIFYPPWHFRAPLGYTTYIYKALTAGNILGQDGVYVYANYFAGYGFGYFQSSPKELAVVLPGKLPPPLELDGTYIVPPPPPPPEEPNCDGLSECADLEGLNVVFERFPAPYSAADTEAWIGGTAYWSLDNLNGGYHLPYVDATTYDFRIDFVAVTEDYDDPGVLVKYNVQDSDPTYKRERYVTHIVINVTCADGAVTINYVNFYYQIFTGYVGSTWPTLTAVDVLWQAANSDGEGGAVALECASSTIRIRYEFEDFDTAQSPATDYSHEFIVNAAIGPSL